MPLHRWSDDNGYDNPSVYCTDQKFLDRAHPGHRKCFRFLCVIL